MSPAGDTIGARAVIASRFLKNNHAQRYIDGTRRL